MGRHRRRDQDHSPSGQSLGREKQQQRKPERNHCSSSSSSATFEKTRGAPVVVRRGSHRPQGRSGHGRRRESLAEGRREVPHRGRGLRRGPHPRAGEAAAARDVGEAAPGAAVRAGRDQPWSGLSASLRHPSLDARRARRRHRGPGQRGRPAEAAADSSGLHEEHRALLGRLVVLFAAGSLAPSEAVVDPGLRHHRLPAGGRGERR